MSTNPTQAEVSDSSKPVNGTTTSSVQEEKSSAKASSEEQAAKETTPHDEEKPVGVRVPDDETPAKAYDQLLSYSLIDARRLVRVGSWGMAHAADSYVVRPSTVDQVEAIFDYARQHKHPVTLRGSAQSYGDPHMGQNAILIDCTRMNRVLHWDPVEGVIDVEPGVRIADIWRYTLEDGWWPPVVSGTMKPTLAGAAAMNIHGKNNYKVGTIGEYIQEFELLTPAGERMVCSPEQNSEMFYATIGGFGTLGFFTRLRLKMKRIHSGNVLVTAISTPTLKAMIDAFEENLDQDYLVGWVDCTAKGMGLGRGLIHAARHLAPGEDPDPISTMRVNRQELPETLMGVVPKSAMWLGMWFSKPFWRMVNGLKYYMGIREAKAQPYLQGHAAFNFLLDYVPNWKWGYRPNGLVQYQSFVPKDKALEVFETQIKLAQEARLTPYLGVFKKHKPDPFLLTHAVDGYSFALDFAATPRNRERLQSLVRSMNQLVLAAGGRFYFAKDGLLQSHEVRQVWPDEAFETFRTLKKTHDPDGILESDLSRRIGIFDDDFMNLGTKKTS